MKALLCADLYELYTKKTWFIFALLTTLYIAFPVGGIWTYFYFNIELEDFDFLARLFFQIPVFLLTAAFAVLQLCGLFRGGGCRARIAAGHSRGQIFASRILSCVIAHASLYLYYYAAATAFALTVRNDETLRQIARLPDSVGLINELLYGLGAAAILWGVCVFFSFLLKKPWKALAAVLAVSFLLPALVTFPYYLNTPEYREDTLAPERLEEILAEFDEDDFIVEADGRIRFRDFYYISGTKRIAAEALCLLFPSYKTALLMEYADGRKIPIPKEYLVYPVCWYACAGAICAGAYLLFRKQELT